MAYAISRSIPALVHGTRKHCLRSVSAGVFLILAACAGNPTAVGSPCTGFLGEYSQLDRREKVSGIRYYVREAPELQRYTKVMVDPVSILASRNSDFGKLTDSEKSEICAGFHESLRRHLQIDYDLVSEAAPDVLHVRVALTQTKDKSRGIETFEGRSPGVEARRGSAALSAPGVAFVREVRCEYEVLDSQSGERLVAMVRDPLRIGEDAGAETSRSLARTEFDRMAEALRFQLQALRESSQAIEGAQRLPERHTASTMGREAAEGTGEFPR